MAAQPGSPGPGRPPTAWRTTARAYTYPTGDKLWYGTTVEWKNAVTGQKALHFASGWRRVLRHPLSHRLLQLGGNSMRKFHIAYLLVFAPVLMGNDTDDYSSTLNALVANSLPICAENQYLTYASGGLACREVVGAMLNVPDCNKTGQLLTPPKGGGSACTPAPTRARVAGLRRTSR